MLKNTFFALTVFFSITPSYAQNRPPFLLVSDIDDTAKITNVLDKPAAVCNGIFGQKAFLGMPELYQELTRGFQNDSTFRKHFWFPMVFLSGGPVFLRDSLHDMLIEDNKFPDAMIFLKDWLNDGPTRDYKAKKLNIIWKMTALPLLLFGDDTEADPEAFMDFAANHPAHAVLQRYIHKVQKIDRPLPPNTQSYYTAFDVALMEVEAGRLSTTQAIRVGEAILNANQPEKLFPAYTYCPTDLSYELGPIGKTDPKLDDMRLRVGFYATEYCQKRDSI